MIGLLGSTLGSTQRGCLALAGRIDREKERANQRDSISGLSDLTDLSPNVGYSRVTRDGALQGGDVCVSVCVGRGEAAFEAYPLLWYNGSAEIRRNGKPEKNTTVNL